MDVPDNLIQKNHCADTEISIMNRLYVLSGDWLFRSAHYRYPTALSLPVGDPPIRKKYHGNYSNYQRK